jgi:hypothetical protein
MNDSLRVRFSGPLAEHAGGVRAELAAHGYTPGWRRCNCRWQRG